MANVNRPEPAENNSTPTISPFPVLDRLVEPAELSGIAALRLEQARRLQDSVVGSCWTVEAVIAYILILIIANGQYEFALAWTTATSAMVLAVYLYSRYLYPDKITENNYAFYLRGHVWMSGITGLIWSAFAIYQLDPDSLLSLYIAVSIAGTITLGGMFPSSAYRTTFIALLTCNVIPVAVYWFIIVPGTMKFFAFGFIVYYIFGLMTSARTEINMRDLILAEQSKRISDELKSHNEIIEQSNAEKTQFMVATVHDFSQPLHAQGYFIHGLRNLLTDKKQFEMLDRIESSWRSQGELLRGIADITQLDSGLISPRLMRVEIESVLDNVAAEFRGDAQQNDIRFTTQLTPKVVDTDPALLARVIRNLLSNAFKHTSAGGSITLENINHGSKTMIKVIDTGAGIAKEDQALIFDEYVQLKSDLPEGNRGLGLGLSIVKRLANLLSIEVTLASTPGKGTTFMLGIESSADQSHQTNDDADNTLAMNSAPLIFLVEPEPDVRESMAGLLADWGCEVVCTSASEEAVTALGALDRIPNLLIVDNRLPDGAVGVELVSELRDEVNESVPVVLMSGDIEPIPSIDDQIDVTIMNKPVQPDELRRFIRARQIQDEDLVRDRA